MGTDHFDELVAFFRDTLGLRLDASRRDDIAELFTTDGGKVEIFKPILMPPDQMHVGFLVDDLDAAERELRAKGVELMGARGSLAGGYQWQRLRAPGGRTFSLIQDPRITETDQRK